MSITASEISELIKKKIQGLDSGAETRTEGSIISLTDGIARLHGLSDVMQGEMIEFPNNVFGLGLTRTGFCRGGDTWSIRGLRGDVCRCTGRILEVPVGDGLLGRVVDALGSY